VLVKIQDSWSTTPRKVLRVRTVKAWVKGGGGGGGGKNGEGQKA